jgi:hypothetical protein
MLNLVEKCKGVEIFKDQILYFILQSKVISFQEIISKNNDMHLMIFNACCVPSVSQISWLIHNNSKKLRKLWGSTLSY